MSIEAIGAASAQAQAANVQVRQEIPVSEMGQHEQTSVGKAEFQQTLTNVYETIQEYATSNPADPNAAPTDPVAAEKEALLPSPYEIHPTSMAESDTSVTNPVQDNGTEVLVKSFDHAISLALLNQVISGISSTTSSLIRQS